jgi:hypothetical protein
MGLKSFFTRWTRGEDERAVDRAEEETRMTPVERDIDEEDYEGRKEDLLLADQDYASSEALGSAADDLPE